MRALTLKPVQTTLSHYVKALSSLLSELLYVAYFRLLFVVFGYRFLPTITGKKKCVVPLLSSVLVIFELQPLHTG